MQIQVRQKTFVIEETDANGNALDSDNFAYEISGEGNVELSMENTKGSITLTNTIKEEESESSSEEETTSTEKEKEKHTPNTTSRTSTGGKTGDINTNQDMDYYWSSCSSSYYFPYNKKKEK